MGLIERQGPIKAKVVELVDRKTLEDIISESINTDTILFTDDYSAYGRLAEKYDHRVVRHGEGRYVDGEAHTNSIESFWALFKRGYVGTYHKMSSKHLQRYVDEFVYRFNRREREIGEV